MRYTSVFLLCVSLFIYAYGSNVSVAQGEIDKNKRWALIIGIGQYERKDDINSLRFTVNDATAIRDALIDPLTGTFLADHVLLLTDSAQEKPIKANILEKLALLENLIKPEDTLLIFFSGHGYPKGREVYLLPQDARLTVLQDTAISMTVWKERIARIPAQTKIIILDACHSGGVEKGKGGRGEMSSRFEQSIAPPVGQATLSSSKRGQTSYEDEESGHGVFTRYLLESLKGQGDADGNNAITLQEASDYVEQRVRAWGFQKGKVQTPYLETTLTEDVILAFAKPAEGIPQTFGIRIDTTPQGAKILLNGQDTQKKTPQIINVPQVGEYPIELTLNGYKSYRGSVTISNNQPVISIDQSLQRLDRTMPESTTQATGILYVKALIYNREVVADVYIDGQKVGKTTYQNADMPSRTYDIEVRGSELYHPYKETIVVSKDETKRVEAILSRAFGSLKVTSEPSDASVDVLDMSDTRRTGGQTPLDIPQIKSGRYRLKLEKDRYYYSETRNVTIEDGKAIEESVEFRPKFGTFVITSEPSDAEVIFDGASKGNTPLTLNRVLSGNYTLELRKELHLDWSSTVQIKDGQTTEMPVTLPTNYGTLKVDYAPKGATVYLNDQEYGKTPFTMKLKPDTYTLRVTAGDKYRELPDQSVLIMNAQTQRVEGTLQRLKGSVTILSTPGEAEIYLNSEKVGVTPKKLVNLDADDYTLTVKKEGYGDYTQQLRIRDGMLPSIDVALPMKGSVKIFSTPTNADIYLDSKKVGVTPKTLAELEPGNYTLTIKKKGYEVYTQRLRIKRGTLPDIDATLEKITVPVRGNRPSTILPNIKDNQTIYTPNYQLRVSVSDDRGLTSAQVRLNGRVIYNSQIDPSAADKLSASAGRLLSFIQPLTLQQGDNVLVISAVDSDNEREERTLHLKYNPRTVITKILNPSDVDVGVPKGKMPQQNGVALVIGIEKYQHISDALYADRDAIAFRQYLIDLFGFKEENIVLLINEDATLANIKKGLRQLSDWSELTSDAIVYYAGHGLSTADGKQQFLIPCDGDPNYLDDSGYSLSAFYQRLSRLKAKSVTMFMDACFSGTDREGNLIVDARPVFQVIEGPGAYPNLEVFASSTGSQLSTSFPDKRHGMFTYYLLKGLRGEADLDKDGAIKLTEIEQFVHEKVSRQAQRTGRKQTPTLMGGEKERVLVYPVQR